MCADIPRGTRKYLSHFNIEWLLLLFRPDDMIDEDINDTLL
jgi:hypothetical protein